MNQTANEGFAKFNIGQQQMNQTLNSNNDMSLDYPSTNSINSPKDFLQRYEERKKQISKYNNLHKEFSRTRNKNFGNTSSRLTKEKSPEDLFMEKYLCQ